MNHERDIERILEAWLEPGPREMPDRTFSAILERVEREPQRRRLGRSPMRFTTMIPMLRLPAAAAVFLVAGLLLAPLLGTGPDEAAPPGASSTSPSTPSKSPAASPSARVVSPAVDPAAIPAEISGRWMAPPRAIEGYPSSDIVALFDLGAGAFRTQVQGSSLESSATAVGPDTLSLVSEGSDPGCPEGDVGTYRWALSDDGLRLTLEAQADDCPVRAEYLTREWWRGRCDASLRSCQGPLPAGRVEAGVFDPRADAADPLRARARAFAYEVPDGWANGSEWLTEYSIVPLSAHEQRLAAPDTRTDQILLLARPVAATLPDAEPCVPVLAEGAGTSIDALAEWVTSRPGITAGTPQEIEIDGHRGLDIDVGFDGQPRHCDIPVPIVPLFASATGFGPDGTWAEDWVSGTWGYALEGFGPRANMDPVRLILLDLDGQPLLVVIDSAPPWEDTEDGGQSLSAGDYRARQAAFVEEAMPIVESFTFPE